MLALTFLLLLWTLSSLHFQSFNWSLLRALCSTYHGPPRGAYPLACFHCWRSPGIFFSGLNCCSCPTNPSYTFFCCPPYMRKNEWNFLTFQLQHVVPHIHERIMGMQGIQPKDEHPCHQCLLQDREHPSQCYMQDIWQSCSDIWTGDCHWCRSNNGH